MAGNLQHASFGIPGGKGLFSPIYKAMQGDPNEIIITPALKQALLDWKVMIQRIAARPTSVLELVPDLPEYVGYVDASGFGAGGTWLSGSKHIDPIVWRLLWPADIEARLVSDANPKGDITNSDLEMAAHLLQWLVLEQVAPEPLKHAHIGISSDNTPTVAWANRLHSSKSIIAGHLLRALAIRQHVHQSSPLLTISIAGILNILADVASRSFREQPFTNNPHIPFLQHFQSLFPLPQGASWKECHLEEKLCSRVISCLRGNPLAMASWIKIPRTGKNTGNIGPAIAQPLTNTHTSIIAQQENKWSSSQLSLLGSGQASTAMDVRSQFKPLNSRYHPYPRQSSWLDNVPRSTKQMKHTKSQWHGLWNACDEMTHRQSLKSQSQSVCQRKSSKQDKTAKIQSSRP